MGVIRSRNSMAKGKITTGTQKSTKNTNKTKDQRATRTVLKHVF